MKTYKGRVVGDDVEVTVESTLHRGMRTLEMHLEIVNHSPDGFQWGYGGSGPAQLAFAILYDMFRGSVMGTTQEMRDAQAQRLACKMYQDFKWDYIAILRRDHPWEFTESQIQQWVAEWWIGNEQEAQIEQKREQA